LHFHALFSSVSRLGIFLRYGHRINHQVGRKGCGAVLIPKKI
jgi:hypothetical protein